MILWVTLLKSTTFFEAIGAVFAARFAAVSALFVISSGKDHKSLLIEIKILLIKVP